MKEDKELKELKEKIDKMSKTVEKEECDCKKDNKKGKCDCKKSDKKKKCTCKNDECCCECNCHEEQARLNEEINVLKIELANEKDKTLRNTAELMNFKRRKEQEISTMLKYANEDFIIELLPVIDNFERAIKLDDNDLSDEVSKFLSGFKMIFGNLNNILNKFEIKEIEALGVEFNPSFHQAVLMESDTSKPAGVVLEVLQKGYMYKDKVIRPAMVKVNE